MDENKVKRIGRNLQRYLTLFVIYLFIAWPLNVPSVEADASTAPPVVQNFEGQGISPGEIRLNWTKFSFQDVPDIDHYNIYRDRDGVIAQIPATGNEYIDSGLEPNFQYQYSISGVDAYSNEGIKFAVKVKTQDIDRSPPKITNLHLGSPGAGNILIEFNTDKATNATLYFGENSYDEWMIPVHGFRIEHTLPVDGLDDTKYYKYRIKVCDEYNICTLTEQSLFKTGMDSEPPVLNIEIPEFLTHRFLMAQGTTEPFTKVKIYVDDEYLFTSTADTNGAFSVRQIVLNPEGVTRITLEAMDLSGNIYTEDYRVAVDAEPPVLTLGEIPGFSESASITVSGTVSEDVLLEIFVYLEEEDKTPPERIEGLTAAQEGNYIKLEWDPIEDDTFWKYYVYRDGNIIADTQSPEYRDARVNSSTLYSYQVAAIDKNCNIGDRSDSEAITTPAGNKIVEQTTTVPECSVIPNVREQIPGGPFSKTFRISDGINILKFIITDIAGNTATTRKTVVFDKENPKFIKDNIGDLDPTYVRDVTITGEMSEPCDIEIVINEGCEPMASGILDSECERTYSTKTDDDNRFSQEVRLTRLWSADIDTDGETSTYELNKGAQWVNTVDITATDRVGLSASKHGEITYQFCDESVTDWDIDYGDVMPAEIVPRLLMEGMASIGFSFELEYLGGFAGEYDHPTIRNVHFQKQELNMFDRENWDRDWIMEGYPKVNYANQEKTQGYVNIPLKAVDELIEWPEEDMSLLEKENYLEENHKGECIGAERTLGISHPNIDFTGIGCVRLPLVAVIEYGDGEGNMQTQKQCLDLMVMITPRIDVTSFLPEQFLKDSVRFINQMLKAIEKIRGPVSKATEYATWGCLAMWGVWFFTEVSDWLSCNSLQYGRIDLKNYEFDKSGTAISGSEEEKQAVNSCFQAKKSSESTWRALKYICDRVMCPSVPSFSKYVREAGKDSFCYNYESLNPEGYFWGDKTADEVTKDPKFDATMKVLATTANKGEYNDEPQQYCEEEYVWEWAPTCGLFKAERPYIRSFCDYAKNYGEEKHKTRYEEECGFGYKFSEAFQGMRGCEIEDTQSVAVQVDRGAWQEQTMETESPRFKAYNDAKNELEEYTNKIEELENVLSRTRTCNSNEENTPREQRNCLTENEKDQLRDEINSYSRKIADARDTMDDNKEFAPTGEYYFWIHRQESGPAKVDLTQASQEIPTEDAYLTNPTGKLQVLETLNIGQCNPSGCQAAMDKGSCIYKTSAGILQLNKFIITEMCGSTLTDDYVINPTGGIWNAVTCACLSAMLSYLNQYHEVLTLIKNCFESILYTGDGSGGVCQQALTMYLCDLIYDAILCFKNKATAGFGTGVSKSGDIFALIGMAGDEVSDKISGRYGENSLYQTLFNQKSLVHSMCIFFFTGEWPLDISAAVAETSVAINPIIEALGNRRFQSYDTATGAATYIYETSVMIVSGANDFKYKVDLVCSMDDSCEDGLCDCYYAGSERTLGVTNKFGDGRLAASESIDKQDFIVVNSVEDPVNNGKFRYDKLRITYEYEDNDGRIIQDKAEFRIKSVGGPPPASCHFDPGALEFRCQIFVDELGETRFVDDPKPIKETFYLNDDVKMMGYRIFKQSPDENNPLTKYLKVSVSTDAGHDVKWYGGVNYKILPISREGDSEFFEPMFKLTPELLGAIIPSSGTECGIEHKGMDVTRITCPTQTLFVFAIMSSTNELNMENGKMMFRNLVYVPAILEAGENDVSRTKLLSNEVKFCNELTSDSIPASDIYVFECGNSKIRIKNYAQISMSGLTEKLGEYVTDTDYIKRIKDKDTLHLSMNTKVSDIIRDNNKNHALIEVTEEDTGQGGATGCPNALMAKFELFHESDAGQSSNSIIYWNGAPQVKNVRINIECKEQSQADQEELENKCFNNVKNRNPDSCTCGQDSCMFDETCCYNARAESSWHGTGYCFLADSSIYNCDSQPPDLAGDSKVTIDVSSGNTLKISARIKDIAETGEKISENVNGRIALYDGEGWICTPLLSENGQDITPDRSINAQPITSTSQTIRLYNAEEVLPLDNLREGSIYYFDVLLYDSAGNRAQTNRHPLFIRYEDGIFHFHALQNDLNDYYEFIPSNSPQTTQNVLSEVNCP